MDVRLFPNSRRPGIGQKPRREGQRPMLPQHSRHCPVLEAGNAAGFLVYAPLEEKESFYVEHQGEGRYRFVYYVNPTGSKWEGVFVVGTTLPVGGTGMFREEVTFLTRVPTTTRENAILIARCFYIPEDLNTPPGGITLRGAWNFQTPAGWDTVYTPVFNMIERPVAPMLVIRVETDWYAHETEMRYVLQPGEGISVAHNTPIGQVLFVPRDEVSLRECTTEELAAIRESQGEFSREKAATKLTTPYGLSYSPHYLKQSRAQRATERLGGSDSGVLALKHDPHEASPDVDKVGRNDPCPCGSGKKYKKCHGAQG